MTLIDTSGAVFKDTIMAYRSARQAGEMDTRRSWPPNSLSTLRFDRIRFIVMSSLTNENAAASFAALGSPARLAVLAALVRGSEMELTVGALQGRRAMPASTLAHHLNALVRAGVMTQTKEGRTVTNRAHLDYLARIFFS